MRKILLNDENKKTIITILEDDKLVEKYETDNEDKDMEGNIYCGIVRNILPGMQSAFIDIGENKNAFIHIKDILPKVSNEIGNKEENFDKYDINDYLKVNMPILVQIKKEREQQKGAKVSTHISLTGKYVVLIPNVNFITVSQKIEEEKEKKYLKDVVKTILDEVVEGKSYGAIIRTAARNVDINDLKSDINSLIEIWKKILIKYEKTKINCKPVKICNAQDMISKILIGIAGSGDCKIIVNNEKLFLKSKKILKSLSNKNIELELSNKDINSIYNLEKQFEEINNRKIWLNCGGFITIDKTEALTAIDVNSGKFIGKRNNTKNDTLYKVNKEATIEIAKQIRLRNINGIIIVDYIDMIDDKDRKSILEILNNELKKDRSKTQVMGFTKLDLLEMTRKKL